MEKIKELLNLVLRSCTDLKFYNRVFHQPFGKTIQYLVLLVTLITVILSIHYTIIFNKFLKAEIKILGRQIPYIEIFNGIVTAGVKQPFITGDKNFAVIIDTTGKIQDIGSEYNAGMLLTKNALIVKQDNMSERRINLEGIKKFRMDKRVLSRWHSLFLYIGLPFIVIFQFVYAFFAKLAQAALAALIVQLFRPQIRYNNIINVCVYALTPPVLLSLVITLILPQPLLYFPLLYIGLYTAFIVGGMRQVEVETQ